MEFADGAVGATVHDDNAGSDGDGYQVMESDDDEQSRSEAVASSAGDDAMIGIWPPTHTQT